MYVAVKGGEAAIEAAHRLLDRDRRGDLAVPALTVDQIEGQLRLAVDRVMTEGALYDRHLAALAIKQAAGDLVEAIFLLRAYRTTLPRFAVSLPIVTAKMEVDRRISAIFKDVPGGQYLGPTFDYTHRLVDFGLAGDAAIPEKEVAAPAVSAMPAALPPVMGWLEQEGLLEPERENPELAIGDVTREPPQYPATRDVRLQALARGDEGFLLSLAYSTQRGYGRNHPFAGEIRSGRVTVEIVPEELGFAVAIGEVELTECQLVNQFKGSASQPPQFTRGYGLVFGRCERKAMAMALVDRSLRAAELEETVTAPAQDEEFVLSHADNVEASGFVQHLKLPHYVDFQAELDIVRQMRAEEARQEAAE
jgi:alpha-D-ribose 1-methylphosphonate 5-triphosphate synthase subunit PhnI